MKEIKIDLTRCARCNKRPRGEKNKAELQKYFPHCSYHCQEWARLESLNRYTSTLK